MKKGLIITSTLALLFGVGVAVGAHQGKAVKASATTETLYFDVSSSTWWNDASAKTYAYCYKNDGSSEADRNASWPGVEMTKMPNANNKYYASVDSAFTYVIFNRVNPANTEEIWNRTSKDGGTPVNLPADYSVKNQFNLTADGTNYDDGNYCGNWTLYSSVTVNVVVNGGDPEVESIEKGSVPSSPAGYGETFSGWFSDSEYTPGNEVTEINSNGMTIYGRVTANPTHAYTLDVTAVSEVFTAPYIYAWDINGHNAEFPGVAVSANAFTIPEGASFIISDKNPKEHQTINITQPASPVANEKLVVSSNTVESGEDIGKYQAYWALDEEAPTSGYYLVGTKTNFKYRGATLVPASQEDVHGNLAILSNYAAAVNEEVTIRSSSGWVNSADPVKDAEGQKEYGYRVDNNFKFTTAGNYDIFVKEGGFYVAPHANRHYVAVTNVMFEGKRATGQTTDRLPELATEGGEFTPCNYDVAGYVLRGYFTNAACTTAYTPAEVTADDVHLYCKYTRQGMYVFGDATFSGEGLGWKVDGATYLPAAVNDTENNLYEGTVTIPAGADGEHPVAVRPGQYVSGDEGNYEGIDYTLETYAFATKVGDNVQFTESGTFAIYVNKSFRVYLNKGADAFYTKFLTEVGAVCSGILGGTKNLDNLKAVWSEQASAYASLSKAEKDVIVAVTINGGDESGTDLQKVVAKYKYIVTKYGTENCSDFIWGGSYPQSLGFSTSMNFNSNGLIVIIIITATVALIGAGVFFILKRKHN